MLHSCDMRNGTNNSDTWLTLAAATARALRHNLKQTDINGVCDREPGKAHEEAAEGDHREIDRALDNRMEIGAR